jgi:hypothetical protein
MTEEQIERTVELKTDHIDNDYMTGKLTSQEYRAAMDELDRWADSRYKMANR